MNENGINSLIIRSCSSVDSGQYTAIATNKAGKAQFSINLTIIEKESYVPPKFTERITGANVVSGQDVILKCAVLGNPEPKITWTKDNQYLQNGNKYRYVPAGY